ncbi:NAD(P)/FAD-dependent oxidoreductase [Rhodospirillaceae bacterium KN72]|uniref:NAD(P)/FAD-dependent oxidoreductase n=1 Tax=Pacificispira spongiicola TaxID=2729598 RepID=A0A7Y0HG91_9PROT|nr:NAD(P)/FAD-dependent oxidoreductase [Pacificispira spongiicola]NMM46685.1 NAD(P)/FAD-dependent oxidoreductase [Pacificispira spongiicola]
MPDTPNSESEFDVIVIGAGAAGMMCAWQAGLRGRRVLLIDHADEPGKKILISGGGRCNFTNLTAAPRNFLSANPHFCKSALARYTQNDFIDLVNRHGIAWHEKTLGQLFCDGSARQIVDMLVGECRDAGVDLRLGHTVTAIEKPDRFTVSTQKGPFTSDSLVLATGGLSIPKMGATGFAYDIARRFGLPIAQTRAGLVPLTFSEADLDFMRGLSGLSFDAVVSTGKTQFREAVLFTHRGLSGPAILQVSSYLPDGAAISVNLLPDRDAADFLLERKRERAKAETQTVLSELLPARLATGFAERFVPKRPVGEVADKALTVLGNTLNAWRIVPTGNEGYAKAEVTVGGIDTGALSSKTMAAKSVPGLYAVGEAVDVTGWLGGYNFQWAWSSGWAAGQDA